MLSKLYFAFTVSSGFYLKPVRFSVPLLLEGPVKFFYLQATRDNWVFLRGYRTTDCRPLHYEIQAAVFYENEKNGESKGWLMRVQPALMVFPSNRPFNCAWNLFSGMDSPSRIQNGEGQTTLNFPVSTSKGPFFLPLCQLGQCTTKIITTLFQYFNLDRG